MKRLAKGDGYGNVYLEDAPVPAVTSRGVLVRAHTSLISRGSEILRRYRLDGPVDPAIMGYSLAGTVVAAGDEARAAGFTPGDRVFALSPHAEYVAVEVEPEGLHVRKLPAEISWRRAPFQSLAYGAVAWAEASQAKPADTVVVLGQGLVGNLVMQAHRVRGVARIITVDALGPRVRLSAELGADVAIHGGQVGAVSEVRRLTDGQGADVVVDCVGGPPGIQSFQDALEMVKSDGTIHLIGLYHGQPLPLDSSKIQRKLLIGGYHVSGPLRAYADRAAELLATGQIRVDPLITHRFPAERAPEAFGLLDQHLDQALGVLLEWTQE
ncbi:MAG TPA: zinc-binding dehydrogenase [Chloroflexota bacterium]|jgi:threonine dehydrogenase-like Zn-dependent dehydrogenase|nr:zinc-binding dehydrogenase [Chloroflexota bacterium]